jgi:hypothetical protein
VARIADRAEARGLPYRELIGVLASPSTYVKLEIRLAISLPSRYLHAPTKGHFKMALRTLMYCVGTHDIGIMYSALSEAHSCPFTVNTEATTRGAGGGRMVLVVLLWPACGAGHHPRVLL